MQEYIQAIQNVLPDAEVHILDPRDDGKHLEGIVISDKFENLSILDQQRLVMNALKQNFKEGLHALSLKTFSLQQWEVERQYYQELL